MNKYKYRFFIGKEKRGAAFQLVDKLKNADTFKHARLDVYIPKAGTSKVIVCLGQRHTVLRGRITRWGAKRIAAVQARLFSYYRFFHHKFKINQFGAEGVIAQGKGSKYKHTDDLLNKYLSGKEKGLLDAEDELVNLEIIEKILKRFAVLWHKKMKNYGHDLQHGQREIAPYASIVNGLRMYSYVAEDVMFYPIEGESAYKRVSSGVRHNEAEMIKMQKNLHYKSAVAKKGKGLNQEEYDAMVKYGKLVKAFNVAIKSKYREEASLALALEILNEVDIAVFTMGIGHRYNYKWLVPRYLKHKDVAFVLITPPELWYWKYVIRWLFRWFMLAVLLGLGYWYWLT